MSYATKSRARTIIWGAVTVAVIAVIVLLALARIDSKRLRQTRRLGDELVAALSAYRDRSSCFPEFLQELVPDATAVIEQPPWGMRQWSYDRTNCDSFILAVDKNAAGYPRLYIVFDNGEGHWVYDD